MSLTGVRVLDLTRLLPGPYATRLLLEMGAEVIKVEDPKGGDYARWSPPLVGDPPVSGLFIELNRGKKSVALDLKSEAGKAAVRALAASSDVLFDSFRPGVLDRLGLSPRQLMADNPRLIYCALTGFGLTGPDAHRAGHDIGYLARAGVLAVSGTAAHPMSFGVQVADVGGALLAVSGVLAALYEREKTGVGKVVDIALSEAGLPFAAAAFGQLHAGEKVRRGHEILDGSKPCYGIYRTKDDRFLAVGALEPKFWMAFVQALELPHLATSPFDSGAQGEKVKAEIAAKLEEKTRAEWLEIFRGVEACVEPVLELDEVEEDPQVRARKMKVGDMIRSPIHVGTWDELESDPEPLGPAPELGGHTKEVLESVGLDSELVRQILES